ncbi:hypothetical protein RvY_02233 [Ramazzottius varieornatus]|uniref:G-protein coupled receptors family 1 profile domain-containing protein n=1 Tax=Ramazzottius varieornatus TaxID=947166 RepID=A0A1D1UJ20_RAMVA|nr:hypothetical protein RvY_02233 [Ramazzottius varieornatus]
MFNVSGTRNLTALSSNSTSSFDSPLKINWTFIPIFLTILTPPTIVLNTTVLLILLTTRSLRTVFNVYIINLLLSDFGVTVSVYSLDIINFLYPRWVLDDQACTAYLYLQSIFHASTLNAHALLGVNRIWAVYFPLHYRQHQIGSMKKAISICIVTFIVINAFVIPGIARDALYFRVPLNFLPCFVNNAAQPVWARIQQALVYDLPLAFLVATIPLVWYKRWGRIRNRNRVTIHSRAPVNAGHLQSSDKPRAGKMIPSSIAEGSVDTGNAGNLRQAHGEKSSFNVWLTLTVSTLICWTPLLVYFNMAIAGQQAPTQLFQLGVVLYSLTVLVDPFLFIVIIPDVKARLRSLFSGLQRTCGHQT